MTTVEKPRLAKVSLTGCFGCHMSLLDIDERILELADLVDLDCSPFDDKKVFDRPVDVGVIEGGCANEHNVRVLRDFRQHCRILVSVGACAINGGVPAMRNNISLRTCLEDVYLKGVNLEHGGIIPKPDEPEPKGSTIPSAVQANLDDPPIHIRPIVPAISGCKEKNHLGSGHYGILRLAHHSGRSQRIFLQKASRVRR